MSLKQVDVETAHQLLTEQDHTYVDVRSIPEFQKGHPAQASNVPLLHLDPQSGQMKPNPVLDEKMREAGYVSVQEAATRTAIPDSTLYDAMDTGKIKESRVGSRRYVEVETLLDFGGEAIRALWDESVEVEVVSSGNGES